MSACHESTAGSSRIGQEKRNWNSCTQATIYLHNRLNPSYLFTFYHLARPTLLPFPLLPFSSLAFCLLLCFLPLIPLTLLSLPSSVVPLKVCINLSGRELEQVRWPRNTRVGMGHLRRLTVPSRAICVQATEVKCLLLGECC